MIRTDPRTPDAVAEYASSVWSAHRTIPPAFARLHNPTRIGYPERLRDPTGSMCNLQHLAGNYRTNKQLIERNIRRLFYERSCEPKTIEAPRGWRDFASNTHLRGDVRCRALLRGVKSAVAKTPTFDAGFAVPGVGRNSEAIGLLEHSRHRDQSRISTLRIIGRYVYHQQTRLMPTRPLVRRYISKAFCAAIMI
jgi:hypothetical protein